MATDYARELDEWASSDYYENHVHKMQLPYAQVSSVGEATPLTAWFFGVFIGFFRMKLIVKSILFGLAWRVQFCVNA